jgi:hypothetical protein|tara:strand:+ start:542 stop:739 length:198 start_codon:yes stop_codon:yes gene_type:complete
MPTSFGDYVLLIFMLLALLMVIIGIVAMALNNNFYKTNSNKLMRMRVLFQGIALIILAVVVWLST